MNKKINIRIHCDEGVTKFTHSIVKQFGTTATILFVKYTDTTCVEALVHARNMREAEDMAWFIQGIAIVLGVYASAYIEREQ